MASFIDNDNIVPFGKCKFWCNIKGDSLYHDVPAMFIDIFISVNIYNVLWIVDR